MSQSLVKNYIHLVFSTKHREPILDETIQPELFRYIAVICTHCDCSPVKIGGYTDHIHALFLLNKKTPLVKFVEEVKAHSSGWIKKQGEAYQNFYWQSGYGAFSINPSEVHVAKAYIENQKEHHRKISFEEEYRAFLHKYGVDYDEKYVWD
ncbi:MAG: IS200/IS605 family transposase [Chitinophagaceae bacterium]|nr:MAG: IS200/IS605 family transposase [Chitinophagaceae bacterium]